MNRTSPKLSGPLWLRSLWLSSIVLLPLLPFACSGPDQTEKLEQWKAEIYETELNFSNMAAEEGITAAFLAYAADDAVLMRNNEIIDGKSAIKAHMLRQDSAGVILSLSWEPEFVDVSKSGDLGYTYGPFTLEYRDPSDSIRQATGVFHTVWKRQPDNSWKYVWD